MTSAAHALNGKGKHDKPATAGAELDISLIAPLPGFNSRTDATHRAEELAASIREHGLMNPITVVPHLNAQSNETGFYWIACGERRYHALKNILKVRGLVRVDIRYGLSTEKAAAMNLAENAQREDVRTADLARRAWAMCNGSYPGAKEKASRETVATAIGMSKSYVANLVRAWDALSEASREAWYAEELPTDFVVATLLKLTPEDQEEAREKWRKSPSTGKGHVREERPSVTKAKAAKEAEEPPKSGRAKVAVKADRVEEKIERDAPTRREVTAKIGEIRESLDTMPKRAREIAVARLDALRWVVGDIRTLRSRAS